MLLSRYIRKNKLKHVDLIRFNSTRTTKITDIIGLKTTSFYKYKDVQPTPHKINLECPKFFKDLAIFVVGGLSKLYLRLLCSNVHLRNFDTMLNLIEDRKQEECLITVQNHASTLDDPIIWGNLPINILSNSDKMRWTLSAREIIFLNPLFNYFFEAGQIIPTVRGDGIYQPAVDASIKLLNEGKWINIYPEGKVNQSSNLLRFKWGVGRMILEAKKEPIILPIYHSGLVSVLPLNGIKLPRPFKNLVFTFGQPIYIRKELNQDPTYLKLVKNSNHDEIRSYVTKVIQDKLEACRRDTLNWMKNNRIEPYFK